MELSEQEIVRRQSLQTMRDMGINPYPAAEYEVTGYSTDIKAGFIDENTEENLKSEISNHQSQIYNVGTAAVTSSFTAHL